MTWLLKLITPFKSELFAMVGVLAVCGIGATIIGYLHIQRQNDQIATMPTPGPARADRQNYLLEFQHGECWNDRAKSMEKVTESTMGRCLEIL